MMVTKRKEVQTQHRIQDGTNDWTPQKILQSS